MITFAGSTSCTSDDTMPIRCGLFSTSSMPTGSVPWLVRRLISSCLLVSQSLMKGVLRTRRGRPCSQVANVSLLVECISLVDHNDASATRETRRGIRA